MAPMKREFESMMFDDDPVFEIDVVYPVDQPRPAKRIKDTQFTDLTTYLMASDDEFDSGASVEDLQLEIPVSGLAMKNPFVGSRVEAMSFDGTDMLAPAEATFQDIAGDLSSDDDNGYYSMFNSPAHVLDAEYDVPFIDDASVAEVAQDILVAVDPTASEMQSMPDPLVEAAVAAAAVATAPAVVAPAPARAAMPDVPPAPSDGKPPVNPTRWAHNSTERKRRLEIRKLFSGLRDLFPDMAGDEKISNITTLNRAIDHVAELKAAVLDKESGLAALRERNAVLRQRAQACELLRGELETRAAQDVPPTAVAVLEGSTDPELRKTLPAALRQLLDHNSRGPVEQLPLTRRRVKPVVRDVVV